MLFTIIIIIIIIISMEPRAKKKHSTMDAKEGLCCMLEQNLPTFRLLWYREQEVPHKLKENTNLWGLQKKGKHYICKHVPN